MKKIRKSLKYFLDNLSFAQKFIILFLCVIVIPMVIQDIVYYKQTEKRIQEEMLGKINETLDDKAEKLNTFLSETIYLAKEYYNNETLYQCIDHEYGSDLEYLVQYQTILQNFFSETSLHPYHIGNMLLYSNNNTLLNGAHIKKINVINLEELDESLSYSNLQPVEGEKGIYFRVSHENSRFQKLSDSRSLSILCMLDHYQQYARYVNLLRIDIDLGYLEGLLMDSSLFDNLFLMDSKGSVMIAAHQYSNSGPLDSFSSEEIEDNTVLLSRNVGKFPVILCGIYDMRTISQEFSQSRRISFGVSLLCLLFAMVCVYAVVGNINRRLVNLVEQSKEIVKGNFVQSKVTVESRDEFGTLENSINQMSLQLEELIEREYKAQISRAELEKETNQARFLALQSQVNPHFMFNALESIRLKAIVKGETETAMVLRNMAKMFRNLIEWDNNIITLQEEIKFLEEFLYIQNYRFEDEFSYEIEVSEPAKACFIPKMILQPLVENACIHGVGAIADNRWIKIEAFVENDILKLLVADNGGGMSREKLEELRIMLKGEKIEGRNVGMWNVNRRLALYYGERYQFNIESVSGKGTKCEICIPVKKDVSEAMR